ncbi:hypothetical protein [Flavobacterium sp.]|uniref:hypothetical protein n=1 Tax=Flavobacterium sp. TaxID=239 RepID=UPI0035297513
MIKNRVDIKDFILEIEKKFPVNHWKVGTINLWPYIRIKLFFYLINTLEQKEVSNKTIKKNNIIERFKIIFRNVRAMFRYLKWMRTLPKKDFLFVGADAHRVDYKKARFNRFFDTLIETHEIEARSIYFEYGIDSKKQYNQQSIYSFSEALKGYVFFKKISPNSLEVTLNQYDFFLIFLGKDKLFEKFVKVYSRERLINWASKEFYPKVMFFKRALTAIKPKKVLILCYYLEDIFALTTAANQLNIETIEMQHGPQSDVHLAYSNWFSIPDSGYDMIPKNYWCWDIGSYNVIQNWVKSNQNYSVKVIGNPWITYWKAKEVNYKHQNYILYSLQPSPLTINQLFPESILNFIKNNPYKWFIRLHPRQLNEIGKIKSFLKNKDVLSLVNIDDATTDPLPLLFSKATLHVTHFSGTIIEASFFNIYTVLLNEIGVFSFQDLISSQKAVYLNPNDVNFQPKLDAVIQQNNYLPRDKNVTSFQGNLFE